tara:strand:- start:683 stop:1417 length:735 start_codon:yes stop_codon:yes gene_type:complete
MIAKEKDYFINTKNILVSLVFIAPFIIIYEFICFFYFRNENYQIRNSADVIIRDFFNLFGVFSDEIYSVTLLATLVLIYFVNRPNIKNNIISYKFLLLMFFEGVFLGLVLLLLLNDISVFSKIKYIYQTDLLLNLYLCIGAGIWEEILFRLILFSFLYKSFQGLDKRKIFNPFILSLFLSSILFSLFHYIGYNGDVFLFNTFIIRMLGGILLGVIYYYRGFGISVMSHISYDFILVSLPLIYTT